MTNDQLREIEVKAKVSDLEQLKKKLAELGCVSMLFIKKVQKTAK